MLISPFLITTEAFRSVVIVLDDTNMLDNFAYGFQMLNLIEQSNNKHQANGRLTADLQFVYPQKHENTTLKYAKTNDILDDFFNTTDGKHAISVHWKKFPLHCEHHLSICTAHISI